MTTNPHQDPEYLEIQITVRSKNTGKATEYLFYKTTDAHVLRQEERGVTDVVLTFTSLRDSEHDNMSHIEKDLGLVDPCTCYEKLTGS